MWLTRCIFNACGRWHDAQSSICVVFFSCFCSDFGLCTLWQVMQDRFLTSCALPCHWACSARLWHEVHTWLTSRELIFGNVRIRAGSPSASTCALPGP